jgi:hypothetical protein
MLLDLAKSKPIVRNSLVMTISHAGSSHHVMPQTGVVADVSNFSAIWSCVCSVSARVCDNNKFADFIHGSMTLERNSTD